MSKINKYACKEEIEEFLDELKLENHVRQHGEIKAFVLEYMLKNPPGKGCVVQVGTFGKTTRSDTHGQNAHGLIISYVCPRLIPLAGDQLMQKRIGGHHVCCRYDGSTKQYVIQIQFNQSNEITDVPINAAKENMTDMFYHTDEYVTENEIDNFLDGLQIERLVKEHQYVSHAIRSILLDYMPVPNRSMQVTTIGKSPATSDNRETKEFGFYIRYQAQKTPAGDNNHPTSIRVGGHHIHGSYNPSIKEFVISVRFNNYNKFQDNSENVRTSILKSREEAAQAQKETKMSNEQIPTDTDLIWKKFREQLEAAKLSEQSIGVIMRTLRDDTGLKKPTAESVLLCTKSRNVTNVFYSHTGKPVTLTDAEKTHLFDDRETLSYGAGYHDAFFIADTSKVKTFEEKMIHRHVGVPKIALHLSNGKSIELPFKKEYIKVTEGAVMIHLDCSVGVSLTNKELNSLTGWALTDLNEVEKSRFFVNGREYTVEEFNEKINPRKQEGAVNPGAGSWADIE